MDLLVSLAYCSAASKVLHEQRPTGIGLMVPHPTGPNGLPQRFDDMNKEEVCVRLLNHSLLFTSMFEDVQSHCRPPQSAPACWYFST